jgi:rhodanese-related sulfurtransferase
MSIVTAVPAAPPAAALAHFESILQFEADCSDVREAQLAGASDFVLLDVRQPQEFAGGHIAGAVNIPRGQLDQAQLERFPANTVFVTYSDVPHCNDAVRAAIELARLGRPVKTLAGGLTGWQEEGFPVEELRAEFD